MSIYFFIRIKNYSAQNTSVHHTIHTLVRKRGTQNAFEKNASVFQSFSTENIKHFSVKKNQTVKKKNISSPVSKQV